MTDRPQDLSEAEIQRLLVDLDDAGIKNISQEETEIRTLSRILSDKYGWEFGPTEQGVSWGTTAIDLFYDRLAKSSGGMKDFDIHDLMRSSFMDSIDTCEALRGLQIEEIHFDTVRAAIEYFSMKFHGTEGESIVRELLSGEE